LETRTVHDPFVGADVQISDRLVDRLRGKYASGPHMPNGNPEFGWRQFQAPPIQHEAAARIEELEAAQKSIMWENAGLRVQVNTLERRVSAQRRHITKLIALLRKIAVR
jgi:hypothetical protein